MSIALRDMKLHLKIVDGQQFKIRKLSGGPTSILHSDGRDVDVELGELRYGERKEMLIELELDNTEIAPEHPGRISNRRRTLNATDQFNQRMGLDALLNGDSPDLVEGMMDRMIDEVPVFEVDGSFYDPSAGRHVSRLAHPVLLTVTLTPPHPSRTRSTVPPGSDPDIVRRRMELLTSDMITRALVLVSRKNHQQAQKILVETRRILHTVVQNIGSTLLLGNGVNTSMAVGRNRKEILQLASMRALQAMMADMQLLSEALEDNPEVFVHDQRNFGAQQVRFLSGLPVVRPTDRLNSLRPWFSETKRVGAIGVLSSVCSGLWTIRLSLCCEALTGSVATKGKSPVGRHVFICLVICCSS